uniref:Uncharacterized protein n=1 Tax=Anopheles christyi TaxID=43041 RepID=A0A182KIZ2_9DIPT
MMAFFVLLFMKVKESKNNRTLFTVFCRRKIHNN